MATLKQKKCKGCGEKFSPRNSLQKACGMDCALIIAKVDTAKKQSKELRERKRSLKTRSEWLKDAQVVFNRYVRKRDEGRPCISCGRSTGCKVNAGHYRSVGACSSLRFDERNVNLQCEHCNCYNSGAIADYRIGLIKKIGIEQVEQLELTDPVKKWSIEDAKAIKAEYTKKIKEIIKNEN